MRFYIRLFSACLLLSVGSAFGQTVVNPGFETGSLAPWGAYISGNGSGSITVSTTAAHSGSYGVAEGPSSNSEVTYQDVYGLTPGQSYVVSVWVKASANGGDVALYVDDTQGHNSANTGNIVPTTTWQQISCIYTVASNGAMAVHLLGGAGSETSYWDDVAAIPVPPVNAGFETGSLAPWGGYISGNGSGSITVSTAAAHSGSYGVAEGPSSNSEVTYQYVYGLSPAQSYVVSVWVKASASTGYVSMYVDDTQGNNAVGTANIAATTSWQQISCTYKATSNAAMAIHLVGGAGSETSYWDDVTVIPVPPVNAGFETGSLAPWGVYISGNGSGSITVSTAGAHSGSYGVAEGPSSNSEVTYQYVYGLSPAQSYVVSVWVKASASTGYISMYVDDTQGNNAVGTGNIAAATSWQQISCTYKATSNAAMAIHLVGGAGSETSYWDDVTVIPVPPVNAGFETGSLAPWGAYISGNGSGSITVSTTAAHSGSYGVAEGPSSNSEVTYQYVYSLTPGQSYVVSVWVKASASTGYISMYVDDTQGNNAVGTGNIAATTSWQQISCTYKATSNAAMAIHLVGGAGSETSYWDDVTVSGSFGSNVWANFAAGSQGIIPGIDALTIWENPGFYSVSSSEPAREYIRLNGQVVVIENGVQP